MGDFITSAGGIASAIMAVIGLVGLCLIKPIKNAVKCRKDEKADTMNFRKEVREKLNSINSDIGDLQYERLSQAHDFYTTRGWCPSSKKTQLCQMYKSYHNKGRNHLSEHYEKDIMNLSDRPTNDIREV